MKSTTLASTISITASCLSCGLNGEDREERGRVREGRRESNGEKGGVKSKFVCLNEV
jgi:hypothetical protein